MRLCDRLHCKFSVEAGNIVFLTIEYSISLDRLEAQVCPNPSINERAAIRKTAEAAFIQSCGTAPFMGGLGQTRAVVRVCVLGARKQLAVFDVALCRTVFARYNEGRHF